MTKRMIIMLGSVILIFAAVFGFILFKDHMIKQYMSENSLPPQTVTSAVASYEAWQPKLQAVGSLKAVRGVDLSSELAGIVSDIHFKQGEEVAQNAPLLQLRAQDDLAKLDYLKASAELARITFERDKAQFQAKAVSQQTLDADVARLSQANASLAEQQVLLEKKLIRAPFPGRLGLRMVNVGQYLEAGSPIVTLQALDPIYFDFFLPQQSLDAVRIGQKITVNTDAFPKTSFPGEISVINPKVDLASRNVQIRATLKNPERKLLPGMYGNIEIALGDAQQHLTLPNSAIAYNPYGAIVYLIDQKGLDDKGKPKLIARESFVATGERRGDQVAVLQGIQAGEQVVTSGQIKLRNGTPLIINNAVTPSNAPAASPSEE